MSEAAADLSVEGESRSSHPGLRVFISYRREDTKGFARALKTELASRYGKDRVFMDLDNISPGELWEDVVRRAVRDCDALITLIGRRWLSVRDAQKHRRLDDPKDPVRLEIEAALSEKLMVIPALLEGAKMPAAQKLPESLAELPRIQALTITDDWDGGLARLVKALDAIGQANAGEGREPNEIQDSLLLRDQESEVPNNDVEEPVEAEADQPAPEEAEAQAPHEEPPIDVPDIVDVLSAELSPSERKGRRAANYTIKVSNPSPSTANATITADSDVSGIEFSISPRLLTLEPDAMGTSSLRVADRRARSERSGRLVPFNVFVVPDHGRRIVLAGAMRRRRPPFALIALVLVIGLAGLAAAMRHVPPPTITVVSQPPKLTSDSTVSFQFSSSAHSPTFTCTVDAAPAAPCGASLTLPDLQDGSHMLVVWAADPGGHRSVAMTVRWTVDSTRPTVTITSGPNATTIETSAVFQFASEDGATFNCNLDKGPRRSCLTGVGYADLPPGDHTFTVFATDPAGNVGRKSWAWTVEASPPQVTPPTNVQLPSVVCSTDSCTADVGVWNGTDPTYTYQWEAYCQSDGTGCQDVPFTTDTADRSYLCGYARVLVTATNAAGTDSAYSDPILADSMCG